MKTFYILLLISFGYVNFPEKGIFTGWELSSEKIIRWPLGPPTSLAIGLPSDELLFVLAEHGNQQTQAHNAFNNWGINQDNIVFIKTSTYTYLNRDYGPKFLIGDESCQIINQHFNGFLDKNCCPEDCDNNMIFIDCEGNKFCNNQPDYSGLGQSYI